MQAHVLEVALQLGLAQMPNVPGRRPQDHAGVQDRGVGEPARRALGRDGLLIQSSQPLLVQHLYYTSHVVRPALQQNPLDQRPGYRAHVVVDATSLEDRSR